MPTLTLSDAQMQKLLAVLGISDGDVVITQPVVVQQPQAEAKAKRSRKTAKGRYSQPATKVQLRVVFDKAAGADYGTVAVDCKSDDGIVLARKGEPLDMVLNNLRTYNKEADEIGAPIYAFSIVGRNGTAVKAASLVAARRASANR